MTTNELYFKTAFACMSCDGDIADEEVKLIKRFAENSELFKGIDIEKTINDYVLQINQDGTDFLKTYLTEVEQSSLTDNEQLELVSIAVRMIYADNIVQYSEVVFFKKIRKRLSVTDEQILAKEPDIEEFLLPDIEEPELLEWDTKFEEIKINVQPKDVG